MQQIVVVQFAGKGQSLAVRRVIASAGCALDQEIADLTGVGVHQHCGAVSAAIIDSVDAGDENRRCCYDGPDLGGLNQLETDARVRGLLMFVHGALPLQAGALQGSQPPTPD